MVIDIGGLRSLSQGNRRLRFGRCTGINGSRRTVGFHKKRIDSYCVCYIKRMFWVFPDKVLSLLVAKMEMEKQVRFGRDSRS